MPKSLRDFMVKYEVFGLCIIGFFHRMTQERIAAAHTLTCLYNKTNLNEIDDSIHVEIRGADVVKDLHEVET
ncbi:unnamed protein product [Onchocerca flexuosa]|uniref:Uncharacterized protein n=1 Tax=Onchocerca flexuosa TaxID=387005 RepID=A0A183HAY1_9BILA|nr:unnamed protein product [Onchocerca flexuosa]